MTYTQRTTPVKITQLTDWKHAAGLLTWLRSHKLITPITLQLSSPLHFIISVSNPSSRFKLSFPLMSRIFYQSIFPVVSKAGSSKNRELNATHLTWYCLFVSDSTGDYEYRHIKIRGSGTFTFVPRWFALTSTWFTSWLPSSPCSLSLV